jgi:hypothetical protein
MGTATAPTPPVGPVTSSVLPRSSPSRRIASKAVTPARPIAANATGSTSAGSGARTPALTVTCSA